jgi:hypothetical protein
MRLVVIGFLRLCVEFFYRIGHPELFFFDLVEHLLAAVEPAKMG